MIINEDQLDDVLTGKEITSRKIDNDINKNF
jgi:hypothetical protein